VFACKQVLKGRLVAVQAFETSFQNFVARSASEKNISSMASLLYDRSNDAISEYQFLENRSSERFATALKAYDEATTTFEVCSYSTDEMYIIYLSTHKPS